MDNSNKLLKKCVTAFPSTVSHTSNGSNGSLTPRNHKIFDFLYKRGRLKTFCLYLWTLL